MRKLNVSSLALIAVSLISMYSMPSFATVLYTGGSNYNFYSVGSSNNDFHCFGAAKNYVSGSATASTIDSQLTAIYNSGKQKRLRFSVGNQNFEEAGNIPGVTCNSSGTGYVFQYGNGTESRFNLSADLATDYYNFTHSQYYTNLYNFIVTVANHGFTEVEIQIGPAGGSANDAEHWASDSACNYTTGLCEPYFSQNWTFMTAVRELVNNAIAQHSLNLTVKYDLWNEHAPESVASNIVAGYLSQMWINWNVTYGKSDTVGMSFACISPSDLRSRVDATLAVYDATGYGRPYNYDVHLYSDAVNCLSAFDDELTTKGDTTGKVIIGEAFYDDLSEAAALSSYITNSLSRQVLFLLQWPVTASDYGTKDVSVAPPSSYYYWNYYGF
jgi:hypothetical protein